MVAEQREDIAAVVAEGIELGLALLVLLHLVVGKKAPDAVKAAQILPRRGDDYCQHDHERKDDRQHPFAAARRGLRAADLLADILFLSAVSH